MFFVVYCFFLMLFFAWFVFVMGIFCRYCVKDLPIYNFKDGLKTSTNCLEYKIKNYDKHKDKVNETRRTKYKEDEEYRKKNQERIQNYWIKLPFVMYVIHQ